MKNAGRRRDPEPEPPPASGARATATLWILLVLLAASRAAFVFAPGMAAWGLNTMRFLPPWLAWSTWALMAVPLVPALGRRMAGAREDSPIPAPPAGASLVPWAAAGAAMLLVFLLPDRTQYVGDFLLRQGSVVERLRDDTVFRQALPLDRAIHHDVPRWLFEHAGLDANTAARLIGAVDAGALAWIAALLPRVLGLAGPAALATGALAFFGGYLVLFTGYGKAVVELGVLSVAAGVVGLHILRSGRGLLAFGVIVALAIPLHRSAIALMPMAVVVWTLWLRDSRSRGTRSRPATVIGLGLPWIALAFVLPRVVRTFFEVDVPIHLAPAAARADGVWSSAFGGLRLLDFLNVLAMLSPLAVVIPLGVAAIGQGTRRRELILLLALVLPGLILMPFLHPAQGLFRDWDNFIVLGMTLSLLAAWTVGELLRSAPRAAWLGVVVSLGAAVPSVQWLLVHADAERGVDRVRAFVFEAPARTEAERALALDFLGIWHLRANENTQAAEMFRQAVELAPSPRLHIEWALAETQAGNLRGAMEVYQRLIAKTPNDPVPWRGYTAMASRLELWPEARRGATRLLELVPGDAESRALLDAIERQGLVPADST